jgi:hypothetical protein
VRDGLGIGRELGGGRSFEGHDFNDIVRISGYGNYLLAIPPQSGANTADNFYLAGTQTPKLAVYISRKPNDTRS